VIFASLFSGFSLADIGAMLAGCELAWGIEIDPAIAEISRQLGHQIFCRSVTEIDFRKLQKPDILWASPPCTNFSIAKEDAQESEGDIELAKAIIRAIITLEPRYFILENVEAYKRSKSLKLIEDALYAHGYWIDRQVLNAADFGVPQTRRRLILRAVKGAFIQPMPQAQKWIGWHQAIEDLLPNLPETKLADWQVTRLNAAFEKEQNLENRQFVIEKSGAILVPGSNATSFTFRHQNEPSATISDTQRVGNRPKAVLICEKPVTVTRALLIQSKNANQEYGSGFRESGEPATTVITDGKPSHQPKALLIPALNSARVVQISSRCLARFQTLPDWYNLPAKNNLACKGIGNGVPCSFAKAIVQSLIGENS